MLASPANRNLEDEEAVISKGKKSLHVMMKQIVSNPVFEVSSPPKSHPRSKPPLVEWAVLPLCLVAWFSSQRPAQTTRKSKVKIIYFDLLICWYRRDGERGTYRWPVRRRAEAYPTLIGTVPPFAKDLILPFAAPID
jgi:hypothetical protein